MILRDIQTSAYAWLTVCLPTRRSTCVFFSVFQVDMLRRGSLAFSLDHTCWGQLPADKTQRFCLAPPQFATNLPHQIFEATCKVGVSLKRLLALCKSLLSWEIALVNRKAIVAGFKHSLVSRSAREVDVTQFWVWKTLLWWPIYVQRRTVQAIVWSLDEQWATNSFGVCKR